MTPTVSPFADARAQAAALAARELSALELTDAAIARIEARDPEINAVVVRDFERARRAAREADAALARGDRRPLLGVPMSAKESYNVAGLPTTWGFPWMADFIADQDALAVTRLKGAGAIVLGKTNVPFALGEWQAYNAIYGTTNNPWDVTRTPGGSSGGSGAALAAGFAALEIGSDIGGSLRAPAHYCGVCSHKPSYGIIPTLGHQPPAAAGAPVDISVCGPMARSAGDLAVMLDVLAGPVGAQSRAYRLTLPESRVSTLRGARLLVLDTHPLLPASASVRAVIDRLATQLEGLGARVARTSPALPDLVEVAQLFAWLLLPIMMARVPEEAYAEMKRAAAALAPDDQSIDALRRRAAVASHREWLAAADRRAAVQRAWEALFEEVDAILFPPMPTPAFVQDQSEPASDRLLDVDGKKYPYFDQVFYASIASALHLPATTIPLERSPEGLPIGVQIIGRQYEDRTTLRIAELIEAQTGGFVPPPNFA